MKISVIMPVYNAEKYLHECMDSILGQTFGDFELFCINDGSTDRSADILAEYAAKDPRIRLLETPHVGAYKARRAGLERCRKHFSSSYALKEHLCGKVMSGAELFRKSVAAGCYFPGPPMRITRKSVIDAKNCGFPEAPFHGDNYFTTVSLYNSKRAMALNRKYYRRRVRSDSITTSVGTEKIHYASTLNVLKSLLEFPPLQEDVLLGDSSGS